MIELDTLQTLAHHLDFEFDPEICHVSTPSASASRYSFTTISEVGDTRYAEFKKEPHKKPSYTKDPVSGIVDEDLSDKYKSWEDEDESDEPDPDSGYDEALHGLIGEQRGHIALYTPGYRWLEGLYEFRTLNGPGGANNAHVLLGRSPGYDIPTFVLSGADQGHNTAGQITEAIADMKILVPGVNYFTTATHDLGSTSGTHGPSWPNTPPVIYQHLSQRAQGTIEQYGKRVHCSSEEEKANRPSEVAAIASALDSLIFRLRPTIASLAIMELRVRDGRYDQVGNEEIVDNLMRVAFLNAGKKQAHTAADFLALPADAPESERYRRGYWIGMQLMAGAVDTRLTLHEVCPHPEATDAQTLRALSILSALRAELDRRFSYNLEHLLAA